MQKSNILNFILLATAASLAGIIYFSEEESTTLDTLTSLDKGELTSISIRHNRNTTILTKQSGKHWQITQPTVIAANDFRVNSVIKLISAPVHSKYHTTEISLKAIGLDNPKTTVKLNDQLISFGIINPATDLRYVKLADSIYTIEDVYYPLLSSNFATLVSLNLLPGNSYIEKIILLNQTISRNKNGLWQSNIDISADNINQTIDHWQHAQAFGVHQYLQRDSLGEVFIYIKDIPEPVVYAITDTDPWLILARPELGLEYHLDIENYDKLIVPQ